jgi:hypothetical protein
MEKMNAASPEPVSPIQSGTNLALAVGYTLICLMMVTLAIGVIFAGTRLIPAWNGTYLAGLALFFSIEAIYSQKHTADLDQKEKTLFRITEWISFAVLIKIVLYLVHGPAQLLNDIPLWRSQFFETFFTAEYVLALLLSIIVWWTSKDCSAAIEELYERESEASWDDLGKVQNALRDIRNRISSRIFIFGTILVAMAVLARLDISTPFMNAGEITRGNLFPVLNVLAYFILGLLLLSQTQFALLRARWIHQHLPVSGNLARNWMKYGLAFFVILAAIVAVLPTNYSLGLFETLEVVLRFIIQAINFLFMLIMLPITLCLSLFSSGSATTSEPPSESLGKFMAATAKTPLPWWEFLKSLLFWVIFIGVIIFAIRYFLLQNTALWKSIRSFAFYRWLASQWKRFVDSIKGVNQQVGAVIKTGLRKLRIQQANLPVSPLRKIINPSRLSARGKIVYYYLNLLKIASERGLERAPSQTPFQYQQQLNRAIPEIEPDLDQFTTVFVETRYSQHPVEDSTANTARGLWEGIEVILRRWHKK